MKWTAAALLTSISLCGLCAHAADATAGPYHVSARWTLGGDGGWDYMLDDPPHHLLYIARNNRVMVVDTATGKLRTEITGLGSTHGIALTSGGSKGYISDGGANMVRVFDRDTFKVTASIPAGTNPDAILFDPATDSVFAFNGRSHNATVIDTHNDSVVATVDLPGKPEFAQSDDDGNVFVNIEDKSLLVRIDAHTRKVTATWPLAPCESPSGLAIDTAHHRLFAACDNGRLAVVDSRAGKVVATPAIGKGPDAARFDSRHQLVLTTNGEDGTLSVVKESAPDSYASVQTLPTMKSARTLALDSATGTVYTVGADFGPRPQPTAASPRPRPPVLPGTFVVLVLSR